ncbi:hypothetical protein Tco_0385380 [Tanacetum coccineum]
MQGVSKTDFENYVKANDAVLRNSRRFMARHVNAITTRSGKTCEGPSTLVPTPVVSTPLKEPEQNPETSMDKFREAEDGENCLSMLLYKELDRTNALRPILELGYILFALLSISNWAGALTPPNDTGAWRPFLRTAKALIESIEENYFKSRKSMNSCLFLLDFSVKNVIILRSSPGNDNSILDKDVQKENFRVYSNPLFKFDDNFNSSNVNPLFNEMMKDVENEKSSVSNSNKPVLVNTPLSDKEDYYDLEGDVIFLESLLSDDTTHKLSPEVIFDHELQQNESIHNTSITFSPRNDPLHHEFAGEIIINPSRIAREHEEYLSLMTLLCEISTSQSPENFHANPSLITASPIPIEDSDPVQEEINLFLVLDDLIPPGVENDDSEYEDNSTFLPKNESFILEPSSPLPSPEPPDVCLNFKPDTAMKNDFVNEDFNQGEIVLSLNVEDVNSFTFVIWTFLLFFTYPEDSPFILSFGSEDLVFDPDISAFHFFLPFALPKDE